MQTSEAIDLVCAALAAAQGKMKHAIKDADNAHFKSKYADLASVFDAIRVPLAENNLAVMQDIGSEAGAVTVKTRIVHKSGQWIEFGPFSIPADRQNAHGYGSAATYVRRFALASALGVSADDDDGNAAVQATPQRQSDPVDEYTRTKKNPGISKAKKAVDEHVHHLHGCGDKDALMEMIQENRDLWVEVRSMFPTLWEGPDGSGLRGEALKMATAYECRAEYAEFLKGVVAEAESKQPMAAE